MRPPVIVKNTDKSGKVMDGWFVRIGPKSKTFTATEWATDGLAWIQTQLGSTA